MDVIYSKISRLFKDPDDVYSAIYPLYCVCALLGLAPYCLKIVENGKKHFQYAIWPIVKSTLLVIFIASAVTYNLLFNLPETVPGETIKDKLWYYQEIFASLLSCCSVGFSCIFASKIIEVFRNIDEVDVAFRFLAVWVPYKDILVRLSIHLILLAIMAALFLGSCIMYPSIILEGNQSERSSLYLGLMAYTTIILPYCVNILMEMQYIHYLNILRLRYKLLNEYLEALVDEKKSYNGWLDDATTMSVTESSKAQDSLVKTSIPKSIASISDPVFIVDQAASLHIKLTDTAHLINYAFCVQQLLRITVAFVSIVTALFLIAVNFSKPAGSDDTVQLNLFFTGWAFSNALEVMAIVWITSETCEEANTCPRILHKIRNHTSNTKLQDTIEIYSLQMFHNRLSFTVCGLFPLDYTLLYTIVAGVTTYLVILIQFSNADFVKKVDNSTMNVTTMKT